MNVFKHSGFAQPTSLGNLTEALRREPTVVELGTAHVHRGPDGYGFELTLPDGSIQQWSAKRLVLQALTLWNRREARRLGFDVGATSVEWHQHTTI